MNHLEQDHVNAVASDNLIVYFSLALLFSWIASFAGNNGVKKLFNFPHWDSKTDFRFNASGVNNNF